MLSREMFLALCVSLFLATPGFAEDLSDGPKVAAIEPDATEPRILPPQAEPEAGTIRLAPGETYTLRTETTTIAKPAVGGLYTDCLPEMCKVESSGDSAVPSINWEGVRSCCSQGNLQCFWVDAAGRNAITDDFFRCVTANTPASAYVVTSDSAAPAKKKAAARTAKSKKKGS